MTESKPRDWQHNLSEQEVVNSIREVCIKKDVMFDFGKKEFVAFSVERLWLQAMVKYYDQLQKELAKKDELLRECIILIERFDPDDCFTFDNDSDDLRDEVVGVLQKLREGKP